MPHVEKSSDVVEVYSARALSAGLGGLVLILLAGLFLHYGATALAVVLIVISLGLFALTGKSVSDARKVPSFPATCSYCGATNKLLSPLSEDFTCSSCQRFVPVKDGAVLPVEQVRCGFCNELNYFSEKTDALLCESCNREIPIAHDDSHVSRKKSVGGYAVVDDTRLYDLVLVAPGSKQEDVISCLQHMLALNRNQVKGIFEALPATLLTGIPKKKAEMLRAQLAVHDAEAECRITTASAS